MIVISPVEADDLLRGGGADHVGCGHVGDKSPGGRITQSGQELQKYIEMPVFLATELTFRETPPVLLKWADGEIMQKMTKST